MNWPAAELALMATAVITVTLIVPVPAGEIAVAWVSLFTVKVAAGALPKLTAVAPVNPAPVIVTLVPPVGGPLLGDIAVTIGPGRTLIVSMTIIGSVSTISGKVSVSLTVIVSLIVGIVTVASGAAGGAVAPPVAFRMIDCVKFGLAPDVFRLLNPALSVKTSVPVSVAEEPV